jgi:hypothetical protein
VIAEEVGMADQEQDKVVADDERTRQILEQLKSVHAFDLAYETMVGLVNFGSQKMGLLDETRAVRDLGDARLSIELVRAVLEVVEREQGPERTRGLHDALAQMQLAYAHAVQLDNAERAAAREAAPTGSDAATADSDAATAGGGAVTAGGGAATTDGGAATTDRDAGFAGDGTAPSEAGGGTAAVGEEAAAGSGRAAEEPAAKKPAARKPAPKKPAAKRPAAARKRPTAKEKPADEA